MCLMNYRKHMSNTKIDKILKKNDLGYFVPPSKLILCQT